MQTLEQRSHKPVSTPVDLAAPRRAQFTGMLVSATDLLVLLMTFWIAKDGLLSPVGQYPYAVAVEMTLPALVASSANITAFSRMPARSLTLLIIALISLAACSIAVVAVPIAAITYAALWVARRLGKSRAASMVALLLFEAAIAVTLIHTGILSIRATSTFDPWFGNGIGTCSDMALPLACRTAFEIGIPGAVLWDLLLLTATCTGVLGALQGGDEAEIAQRRLLACLSVSALIGFLATAAFYSTTSTAVQIACSAGIWAAVAGILVDARPAAVMARGKKPISRSPRIAGVTAAVVVVMGLLWVNVMTARRVSPLAAGNWSRTPGRISLADVSRPMRDATIAMEDHSFYDHHGFDWIAIHHALRMDIREGQIKEGGSTITQQLAKNLFLSSHRTLWRKAEEAALAWQMERMLSKRRILELYLNTIDYGMGQRGIVNAAQYYFHKAPAQLTLAESAILVGSVPNPMHQRLDLQRIAEGERTALGRMIFFYPQTYSQSDADHALAVPLDRLIYPEKDAWDRGATETIPGSWHGVSFYFFADPGEPLPIEQTAQCFKDRLAGFLDDAHKNLHLTGIDHLGLYNDRTTRFSQVDLSAHAFGQALDMSGFQFADGTHIKVVDHRDPRVMKRLAPVEAMLNRHFDAVVDWNDNPLHQTHLHVEVKGPRSTAPRPLASSSP